MLRIVCIALLVEHVRALFFLVQNRQLFVTDVVTARDAVGALALLLSAPHAPDARGALHTGETCACRSSNCFCEDDARDATHIFPGLYAWGAGEPPLDVVTAFFHNGAPSWYGRSNALLWRGWDTEAEACAVGRPGWDARRGHREHFAEHFVARYALHTDGASLLAYHMAAGALILSDVPEHPHNAAEEALATCACSVPINRTLHASVCDAADAALEHARRMPYLKVHGMTRRSRRVAATHLGLKHAQRRVTHILHACAANVTHVPSAYERVTCAWVRQRAHLFGWFNNETCHPEVRTHHRAVRMHHVRPPRPPHPPMRPPPPHIFGARPPPPKRVHHSATFFDHDKVWR